MPPHPATPLSLPRSCTPSLRTYPRSMNSPTFRSLALGVFLLTAHTGSGSLAAATPPLKVTADLAGDGTPVTCILEIDQPNEDEPFTGAVLKVGSITKKLGEEFFGFTRELQAFKISGDTRKKVLVASAFAEGDFVLRILFTLEDGKLTELGRVEGQGDIAIPGNGTLSATSWMGFWSKTEKHVFGPDLKLSLLPQEFYSVNVEGTVTKSFPVYQTRQGKTVLANTRQGSKFQVLLWDPASRKIVDEAENLDEQWYLIRTESGFTGWVKGVHLQGDFAELPWAG